MYSECAERVYEVGSCKMFISGYLVVGDMYAIFFFNCSAAPEIFTLSPPQHALAVSSYALAKLSDRWTARVNSDGYPIQYMDSLSPTTTPPPLSADVIYTECADHRTFIVNFIFLGPFKMKCCFSAADCIVFMTWPTQVSCP